MLGITLNIWLKNENIHQKTKLLNVLNEQAALLKWGWAGHVKQMDGRWNKELWLWLRSRSRGWPQTQEQWPEKDNRVELDEMLLKIGNYGKIALGCSTLMVLGGKNTILLTTRYWNLRMVHSSSSSCVKQKSPVIYIGLHFIPILELYLTEKAWGFHNYREIPIFLCMLHWHRVLSLVTWQALVAFLSIVFTHLFYFGQPVHKFNIH